MINASVSPGNYYDPVLSDPWLYQDQTLTATSPKPAAGMALRITSSIGFRLRKETGIECLVSVCSSDGTPSVDAPCKPYPVSLESTNASRPLPWRGNPATMFLCISRTLHISSCETSFTKTHSPIGLTGTASRSLPSRVLKMAAVALLNNGASN